MTDTPEFAHLRGGTTHDLREAVTLAKGWLEAVLKNWATLDDQERQAMIAAALFGANRVGFVLDVLDGGIEEKLESAPERTAHDLLRIASPLAGPTSGSPDRRLL
ncbi:MAG TPA: hypothetical protein VFK89_11025 [Actinomycetota bacterium]|nr:hypothetical protein [Actinomycetota bacterium]